MLQLAPDKDILASDIHDIRRKLHTKTKRTTKTKTNKYRNRERGKSITENMKSYFSLYVPTTC